MNNNKFLIALVVCIIIAGIITFTHQNDTYISTASTTTASTTTESGSIKPALVKVGSPLDKGYQYLVDSNTGVVYIEYSSMYQRAITVMLNADGTPITADQLGIEY